MKRSASYPFVIGLTGGIASGKTQVSNGFAALGIEVVDADVIARDIVAPGSPVLAQLIDCFGRSILQENGALNRAHLRVRVFADPDARQVLNGITHPAIASELRQRCQNARSDYVIAAIPLLVEAGGRKSGQYAWLQRIVVVDVSQNVQHARLCQRDGIDSVLAWQMIAAQASRKQRLALADDVIINDDTPVKLQIQVQALDIRYRQLAKAYHANTQL